jgi:proteic killer suppression protein
MIKSFKHRGLKRFYERGDGSGLNAEYLEKIKNILTMLDVTTDLKELNLPSFRLHKLSGDLKGFWSVTVRSNWRIIFRFENEHVQDVDFVDYH